MPRATAVPGVIVVIGPNTDDRAAELRRTHHGGAFVWSMPSAEPAEFGATLMEHLSVVVPRVIEERGSPPPAFEITLETHSVPNTRAFVRVVMAGIQQWFVSYHRGITPILTHHMDSTSL